MNELQVTQLGKTSQKTPYFTWYNKMADATTSMFWKRKNRLDQEVRFLIKVFYILYMYIHVIL